MTKSARWGAVLAVLLVIALGAIALAARQGSLAERLSGQKPTLLLLTSLPIVFGEDFSLEGNGSPVLSALDARYRVVPVSTTGKGELAKGRLLLLAHPLAQPAENLVDLDEWVRQGGRVLLLADPLLDWHSARPLGDPLRPPPMFADTGLLAHWGLRLDAPIEHGPTRRKLGGFDIMTASPGELSGNCSIGADRLVAHCKLGKGKATVVADADLLDVDRLKSSDKNLDALLSELAELE